MSIHANARRSTSGGLSRRIPAWAWAFLATLLASPSFAAQYNIPAVPLQTGAAYPPPNIMFLLDDSGSMGLIAMPTDIKEERDDENRQYTRIGLQDNPTDRSYLNNTIYYNPAITYLPWRLPTDDGSVSRMTGGTSVDKVFVSLNQAAGSGATENCDSTDPDNQRFCDLRGTARSVFYVPKTGVTASTTASDFNKYRIDSSGVVTLLGASAFSAPGYPQAGLSGGNSVTSYPITVPSGLTNISVTTSGGSGNVQITLKQGTTTRCGPTTGAGNADSCQFTNPAAGSWSAELVRSGNGSTNYSGVTLAVTFSGDLPTTPTGRTQAAELQNIATWFSYYRTRVKTAKGGALEAFAGLGSDYRVGFSTINTVSTSGSYIPVGTDGGLFRSTNRQNWFTTFGTATTAGSTPLRSALKKVGGYYQQTADTGPWGPSPQLACRQSFTILSTDGYWTDETISDIGDADGDGNSPTLADVAKYYYVNDLRTTLDNKVPYAPVETDRPTWQRMVTFGLSIGLNGTSGYRNVEAVPAGYSWRNPMDTMDGDRIDDLLHAAYNSKGDFVVANDPNELANGLRDALSTVAERLGSGSSISANSTSIGTDTYVYQASYTAGRWSGDLKAFQLTSSGLATTAAWSAAANVPDWTLRKIFGVNTSGNAVAFPGDLSIDAAKADYIRGDRSRERSRGGTYRNRDSVLGDIVNSSPTYVKDSNTLYVGANDGMLHAFNASTGVELFAYVPKGLSVAGLESLTDPYYTHRYFVDGPVAVSSKATTSGKNYLVGTLGRGGKGLFTLDVTDPTTFAATNVLWDKTGGTDADMGLVLGQPLIVTLNDGTEAVIVGNGINSTNEDAVLYVFRLSDGVQLGKITVGGNTSSNGLSDPRGWDSNGDGTVDAVYSGDMLGNLWKFDFSSTTLPTSATKMFTTDAGQPISSGLALARDPATGKRWVFFGTGQYLQAADATDTTVQMMYGLIDEGTLPILKTDLEARTIQVSSSDKTKRSFQKNTTLTSGKKGWYLSLGTPTAGERVTSRPQMAGSVLVFSSVIPPTVASCDVGGTGYLNAMDAFTGTGTGYPYLDADNDGDVDNDDTLVSGGDKLPVGSIDLGIGMPTLPKIVGDRIIVGGSKGELGNRKINPPPNPGRRISWREILRD